jgi:hypothetical protein
MTTITEERNHERSGVVSFSREKRKWKMARESEKARPHVFPPTSKASGMDETVTARKKADEQTRRSHIGPDRAGETRRRGRNGAAQGRRDVNDAIGWSVGGGIIPGREMMMRKQQK